MQTLKISQRLNGRSTSYNVRIVYIDTLALVYHQTDPGTFIRDYSFDLLAKYEQTHGTIKGFTQHLHDCILLDTLTQALKQPKKPLKKALRRLIEAYNV